MMKKKETALPIHFFTIVLNGEPFIRHHIDVFKRLNFTWHWHIIEGVADLKHDTGWSVQFGGRITGELHRNGLSNDGTTEYLNELAQKFPENITVYRNPKGAFWDGKLEMVNAPLVNINKACLLWQVDVDEYWTLEQIDTAHKMFENQPDRSAAYYFCNFFVGPELVITTRNTYGNHTDYEWLRTWRCNAGDRWTAHEPPRLCRRDRKGQWIDIAKINPFMHLETESNNLIFNHYAYVTEQQLRFKEIYYGYSNAVKSWKTLQSVENLPVHLKDYFPWVKDEALVDRLTSQASACAGFKNILWVRTDSIGDNILASSMLPHIYARFNGARITVLCQTHISELYEACPYVDKIISFDRKRAITDEAYRNEIIRALRELDADLVLNSVYSRELLTDFFAVNSGANVCVAFEGDLSNMSTEQRQTNNANYSWLIKSDGEYKSELERSVDFLQGIGVPVQGLEPILWITPDDEKFADDFFSTNKLLPQETVALFVCSQWTYKYYDHYKEVLGELCKDKKLAVLALGSDQDIAINQEIIDDLDVKAVNLAGKTTLRQTAALIKRCRLGIGADTGAAHIACAVGTPTVIILGGGHFGRFFPYSHLTSTACLPLECYSCNWQCRYGRVHCIKDIKPEVVVEAIRQTLGKYSEKPRIFVQGYSLWEQETGYPRWQSFHNQLNAADVEMIPVGEITSFISGVWQKLTSFDKKAQVRFLQDAADEFILHGEKLFFCNDYEGAELSFCRALELQNNPSKAQNCLGVLYYQMGDNERARKCYEAAVHSQPDNATFVKNLADFYYVVQKDKEKAVKMYIKGLKINPEDMEIFMALGNISIETGQLESAKDFYKRILNIDPENNDALQ